MKNANCACTDCTCEKPMANLTINKGRIKKYDKNSQSPTYYLKDGQEFEVELFNPKSNNVMVKIKLNGEFISQTGVVIKPGQRVFLDRYIDVAKKFKFETYEVGKSEAVKKAIENNGDIEFLFYNETISLGNPILLGDLGNGNWRTPNSFPPSSPWDNQIYYSNHNYYSSTNIGSDLSQASFSTTSTDTNDVALNSLRSAKKIETGRIEKGDDSKQKFDSINMSFDSYVSHTVTYKLLPLSNKNVEVKDLKKYCTNCGASLKKSHRFCAQCGTKG